MKEITYVKDSFTEYLGKKDHISASDIKNFMKSPKYYFYKKYQEQKKENQRHYVIGSAIHEAILEPSKFKDNYCIAPKFDRRTKEGKAGAEAFEIENFGKVTVFEDEMVMIKDMCESALKCDSLTELIRDSYKELSVYTIDTETGLKIKLRPDIYCQKHPTIVDLKSCVDSSPKDFKKDVYNYGYSTSAAFYMHFSGKENYLFCALSKTAPFEVAMYALCDDMLDYGTKQYRVALDLIKWSYDNNYWCSHNEFSILLNCHELGNLDDFFQIAQNSDKITILQ